MSVLFVLPLVLLAVLLLWRRRGAGAGAGLIGRGIEARTFRRVRQGERVIFAVCELDRFEPIRRHIGYVAANAIVKQFADSIAALLPGVTIGRLNRTTIEFAWTQDADADETGRLRAILAGLPDHCDLDGCTLDLRPRIGFSRVADPELGDATFELIESSLADPARHALDLVPVGVRDRAAGDEFILLKELSDAIAGDRLEVHYQPKLDCRSERVTSVEALLRWTHPTMGVIAPDHAVRVAEETGLIRRLTFWVLHRVLRDLETLKAQDMAIPIYVNVSGALLPDESFATEALGLVAGSEPLIGFEITETAVIDDPDRALANLTAFRAAGLSIAIDDYGSGLSSLAYLKQLPAQELKIDRLFIKGLTSTHRDPLLVRSSIDLAHALEMTVTAEGVDNPMAYSLLRIMGCDTVQGFLVAKALPLEALIAFLARESHVAHLDAPASLNLFARSA